jgi:hypothetical protein
LAPLIVWYGQVVEVPNVVEVKVVSSRAEPARLAPLTVLLVSLEPLKLEQLRSTPLLAAVVIDRFLNLAFGCSVSRR